VVLDGPGVVAAVGPALIDRGIRTIVIDDRGDMPLAVDALVNHNFHAPALAASYPAARLCLLGRRYLMLRRDIRRYPRGACRPRTAGRLRIVLSFGGSDPVGATARTLRLFPAERPADLLVLAGPGFADASHTSDLQHAAAAATFAGHTVDVVRSPADPAGVFVHADAAICAAGGTLGELAYLGCPALGFAIVADQIAGAHHQRRSRLIAGGQSWPTLDDAALRSELLGFVLDDRARRDHRDHALATADGGGAQRIVTEALG
jgi:UDP-2,4-diacetamido-2,4,6-trideoxy-beta-L-altropyranose hydrolase